MPKATLSFNLPDEEWEFKIACNAPEVSNALSEFANWLRSECKHGPSEEMLPTPGQQNEKDKKFIADITAHVIGKVREKFHQFLVDIDL